MQYYCSEILLLNCLREAGSVSYFSHQCVFYNPHIEDAEQYLLGQEIM